ncbi:hypothetical protein L4C54_15850 [Vibrio lamellibrachiae]|uniref:DNA alkylation repair protein n=1 Tax=Vibrio lamellibrachiae TaxID=2910253 RepID=UPI003D0DEFCE
MEPLKNNLSPQLVQCFGLLLERHLSHFDKAEFEQTIIQQLDALELKERAAFIAEKLYQVLPKQEVIRFQIIRKMLRPVSGDLTVVQSDKDGITGWGTLPLGIVVSQFGYESFDDAMALLKDMTEHFSSEFDVRFFLIDDQDRALDIMSNWLTHRSHHVRRLVSEGTRPRLPWAMQLPSIIKDPSSTLPLLTALRDDEHEYVRRSVANHLNDIAKDHPDLVAKLAVDWMNDAKRTLINQPLVHRQKLLRHACRTLIKQGHPVALEAFGVFPPKLDVSPIFLPSSEIHFGTKLCFSVELHSSSDKDQSLIVDYVMHFKKANGEMAQKVFKWKNVTLKARSHLSIEKAHGIREITTRKYYPGTQAVSLQINGQPFGYSEFNLIMGEA